MKVDSRVSAPQSDRVMDVWMLKILPRWSQGQDNKQNANPATTYIDISEFKGGGEAILLKNIKLNEKQKAKTPENGRVNEQ